MFVINEDKSIYVTRGDVAYISVSAIDKETGTKYKFKPGDVVKINVFGKKDTENVVLEDAVTVTAETEEVEIFLNGNQTKFGKAISKPTDYWYEVVLNPTTNPQTIIGYDEEGAKIFRLYPEGDIDDISTDIEDYEHLTGIKRYIQGEIDLLELLHGQSAYEIALQNGFEGTEQEWLESLMYVPTEEDKAEMLERVSKEVVEVISENTIKTITNASIWELEAGAYFVKDNVFYATPQPPQHPNNITLYGKKSTLFVTQSNNAQAKHFILFAGEYLYFGQSWLNTLNQTAMGSYTKVVYNLVNSTPSGGGITATQITALDNMFKISAFTENPTSAYNSFKEAFGIGDDTNTEDVTITLSANTLTFNKEESQTLIATVEPTDVIDEIVWKSSNNAIATVENGIVTPVSDGSCIITATVRGVSAQCNVIVAIENEVITYKVNNYLTNVTSSNSATSVNAGQSYTATLTANEGYAIDENSIVVSMNATEITDSVYNAKTNEISIATVTGDISITASAVVSISGWDFEWDYTQGLMSENGFTLIPTIVSNTQAVDTTEEMREDGLYLAAAQGSQLQVVPTGHETMESGVMEITFIAQECNNRYIRFDMSNGTNGCRMTMSNTQWQFGGAWAANKSNNNEYTIRIVFNKDGTHYLYADATSDSVTKTSTTAEAVKKTGIQLYHGVSMWVKSVKYKWNV